MEASNWPKRPRRRVGKRVGQACGRCREAKIRCDDKQPTCGPCRAKRLECDCGSTPRTRTTQALTIEDRLVRIETLLQAPARVEAEDRVELAQATPSDLDQSANLNPGRSTSSDLLASSSNSENTERTLWQPNTEIPLLRLTESRVSELKQSISKESSWQQAITPMFSKPEVLLLVEFYLDGVNPLISLFERNELLERCENHFPVDSDTWDPAWWACLNAIVAITIQMKTISSDFVSVGRFSWGFFKNAFAVYGDLMLSDPTIMSVKAMLTMAMFLSGTTDASTMRLLLSSAGKRSQMLGLDLENLDSHPEPPNLTVIKDRRRTYRAAYLLEAAFSMNCGFTPAFSNHMAESPTSPSRPSEDGDLPATLDSGNWSFFGTRVELAIIESKAQECLRNPTLHGQGFIDAILILRRELEAWRRSLPPSVRPQYNLIPGSEPTQLSVVMLHCAFYRSLDTVNRAYHLSMVYQSPGASASKVSQLPSGGSLNGPRATIRLIRHIEGICYTDLWRLLPYPLCSAITIYAHILEHSHDVNTASDVELISSLAQFIRKMQNQGCDLDRLLMVCTELERSARLAARTALPPSPATHISDADGLFNGLEHKTDLLEENHSFLLANPDYMPLVQGLMGNIPTLGEKSSDILSGLLSGLAADDDGLVSVGPVSLHPSTYGFNF